MQNIVPIERDGETEQSGALPVLELVRRMIDEELPTRTATMRNVAARLNMSERTLRRRLRAHNTNFEEVLDSLRRERALIAVAEPDRRVVEISKSAGFSEVSAFYRAFKRWTHSTVASYRRAALGAGGGLRDPG